MKKLLLTLCVCMTIAVSCNNKETVTPKNDFKTVIANLNSMYKTGITFQVSNLKDFTSLKDGKIVVDYDGLNKKTAEKLNSQFFGGMFNPLSVLQASVAPKSKSLRLDDDYYSAEQQVMVDDYVGQMYNATDSYSADYVVQSFQNDIIYSSRFSYDQQIQLLAVVQAGDVLSDYVFSGSAARDLGSVFAGYVDSQYSEFGCSVDWRGVWGGAVIGLGVGAVRGAIIGGAGGTVALPLLGTVTGAVGGAVFGGAAGFVEGALAGVAGSLLLSCFR